MFSPFARMVSCSLTRYDAMASITRIRRRRARTGVAVEPVANVLRAPADLHGAWQAVRSPETQRMIRRVPEFLAHFGGVVRPRDLAVHERVSAKHLPAIRDVAPAGHLRLGARQQRVQAQRGSCRCCALFRRYMRLSLTFSLPRISDRLVGQVEKRMEMRGPASPITMREPYSRRAL